MSCYGRCIAWTLAWVMVFGVALFFSGNSVFASGANNAQCAAPRTAVAKSVILAALSDADKAAPTAAGNSSAGDLLDKQTVVPRSEWIRVAPLVTTRCCGGYTCDQSTGTCVCNNTPC